MFQNSFTYAVEFNIAISFNKLFHVPHILMGFTYLYMFVSAEESDSPAYPEDFQEIEVKEEVMDYDVVSCDLL